MWHFSFQPQAVKDLKWLRKHDRRTYIRCFDLIRDLFDDPRTGIGKPERLKHQRGEVWSRRITQEHRLVYVIEQETQVVAIIACRSHYENL